MKDVDTGIAQYLTFNVNITSGFPFYASEAVEFLAMIFFSHCTNTAPANKMVMIYVKSALMFKIIRKQIIVLMVLKKTLNTQYSIDIKLNFSYNLTENRVTNL